MDGNLRIAFALTLFAGLSTGLGSLVVLVARKPTRRLLSFGLGFSGGVMVFVSLAELLPQARAILGEALGEDFGDWAAYGFFFGGIALSALIDYLVPSAENPHEVVPREELALAQASAAGGGPVELSAEAKDHALARVGLLTTLAIAIHNFPEGMATLVSALSDPSLGISVAVAVAIHNIPEGISVAVLVLFATRSRRKAFFYSFASGLAEPVGAAVMYLVLSQWIDDVAVGGMLSAASGIMVFISFDELLPTAREYGKGHLAISGIVLGMLVMAVSLAML